MNRQPDLSQAQLFLDDMWFEEANYVSRQWHQPCKFPEPVLKGEYPWERWFPAMYGSVLHWRGQFHMWYGAFGSEASHSGPRRFAGTGVCYARSGDGLVWEKPMLELHEFEGSRANNIVLQGHAENLFIDNLSVIDDFEDDEWPLKALYWAAARHEPKKKDHGVFLARSKDGVHWETFPHSVLPQWIDRFNAVPSKVNGKYVVYGRAVDSDLTMGRNGRSVWRSESADLEGWSEPSLVLERDSDDPVYLQYYSLSAFPYEGLLMGGLERMHMVPDVLDTELMWSYDGGLKWRRAARRPAFLSPSIPAPGARLWDDSWVNLPANPPIRQGGQLWFFYTGRSTAHSGAYPNHHGGIGLAQLRVDGFASLHAAEAEGLVTTKALTWPGGDLCVNADPRRHLESRPRFCSGELRVELRDEANLPLAGYTFNDVVTVRSNTHNHENCRVPVEWRDGKTARDLAGQRLRLAFKFRDAHLYSFCARE